MCDQIISDLRSRADAHAGVAVPWEDLAIVHKCSVDRLERKCVSWLALIFLTHWDFVFQFDLIRFTAGTCTKLYSVDFTWGSAGLCTKLSFWVQFYSCTFQPIPKWKRNKVCCRWHPICRNIANHEHSSWRAKSFFDLAVFHPCMSIKIQQKQRERPNRTGEKMQCDHLQSVWGCHPTLWFVEVD